MGLLLDVSLYRMFLMFCFVKPTGKRTDYEVGWVAEPAWTWWQREKTYQMVMLFKLKYIPISFQ
jgi:hypothetical protein